MPGWQIALTAALIIGGAAVMLLAVISTLRLRREVGDRQYGRHWGVLHVLMMFFLLGYLGAVALVLLGHSDWLALLTGVVFFFGALFVYIVVRTGLMTIRDLQVEVQQRQRTEAELMVARDAAEAASSAKSVFLANMGHELRTPLNATINYAEMIKEHAEDISQPDLVKDAQRIYDSGKHLLDLINKVLDMARIDAGRVELQPETFDIATLVRDAERGARATASRSGGTLTCDCPDDIGTMHADRTRTLQIIHSLLTNACKFTTDGSVTLSVRRVSYAEGDTIEFRITDTGIGMSEQDRANLFEPFSVADSSTTRRFSGTGLGLSLSRRMTRLMGGDIEVDSQPDAGSTFTLRLPAGAAA
ncbi:MAG: hypothetical protein GC159_16365 [Phycisphaera sp.]|nr:hypothetical protein [Phycisphaera sp.]